MFPLSPPSCSASPIPLVSVCAPKALHTLLRQTLECDRSSSRSMRQRLSYVFCDADETQAYRCAVPDGGFEDTSKNGPTQAASTSSTGSAIQLDLFGTTGWSDRETQFQCTQSDGDPANTEKCVSARVLFPLDPAGGARREKGSQRKKIVAVDQLVNKGFLKHTWMQQMRNERPSCLILCFDWRKVYDTGARCCECCRSSSPPCSDDSVRQPCCSDAFSCCTRDGCRRNLVEQQEGVASPGRTAAARIAARAEYPRPGQSSSTGCGSPTSAPSVIGSRTPGNVTEPRTTVQEGDVASAEAEAMATIEFFRERLQRRLVVPKMIVFVILPGGMDDPQSAVGFLKRLNPADIAAIFITCGVDDLKTKLEKLEQVCFDCSVEYYENEARRYRKQTQVTFKGDRSQTSAFHVYQTRCLIKAGYMLEFAQQPHAAMKSYITAWQFLTSYSQMAPALERMTVCNLLSVRMYPMYFKANEPSKAAHHAREHRAVLRENPPESPLLGYLLPLWLAQLHQLLAQLCEDAMHANPSALDTHDVWQLAGFHYQAAARYLQHVRAWIRTAKTVHPPPSMKGGLGVPSQWLGQPDSLQHGAAAFETSSSQDQAAAAAAAQEEVFLRFIFFFNEAQVLTHATHLLSKAHIAYKLVGGYRSCPILACELADAMFDSQRMMTARQLYFTLAAAFASHTYGHRMSWQLETKPEECTTATLSIPAGGGHHGHPENRNIAAGRSQPEVDGSYDNPELLSAPRSATSSKYPAQFGHWWLLYRYVLARLTLCISHLLSVPPAQFLYELARVDPRSNSAAGEQASATHAGGDAQQPSTIVPAAAPGVSSALSAGAEAHTEIESCHIALKAAFELLNVLALREDLEDCDGSKRKQMYEFVTMLLPRLKRFQQSRNKHDSLFHVELHGVVVWTALNSELHREHTMSDCGQTWRRQSPPSHEEHYQRSDPFVASKDGLLIGRVCFQHRLGFDLSVLSCAELVTTTGRKAPCFLEISSNNGRRSVTGEEEQSSSEESTPITLFHDALCYCDVYLEHQAVREISGLKLSCLHLSWALCLSVCFQLTTLCSSKRELSRLCTSTDSDYLSKFDVVPGGCWPPPLRRALLAHKLCIPPPPLYDVECLGSDEPLLPALCLSKDSFQLAAVGLSYSKYTWIGELAPYTLRLTVKQGWTLSKSRICFKCTAQELGTTNERASNSGRLLEDEFEAYLMDTNTLDVFKAMQDACEEGIIGRTQKETDDVLVDTPAHPRLLRVPTSGATGMPLVLTAAGAQPGCDPSITPFLGQHATAGQEPIAVPFVFDPKEYRSKLVDAEWASFAGGTPIDNPDFGFDDRELVQKSEGKMICIPIFIRLRRAGFFEVCATLDVNLDDISQRLTASSTVECQRSLELSSSLISLPAACSGETREARHVNVINASKLALHLKDVKVPGAEEEQTFSPDSAGTRPEPQLLQMASGLPCTLLPGESWAGIVRVKTSAQPSAVLLKYSRTVEHLPFPFRYVDFDITENLTTARLPALMKPLSQQYLQISLAHPISSAVGVPFSFSAALKNQTQAAMELVVCLSYPHADNPGATDSAGNTSNAISADCPFMISGQLKAQIVILPHTTKPLYWTLVPLRPGAFGLPTILVEGKARALNVALRKGDNVQATWKCSSDPAHVVVFSKA